MSRRKTLADRVEAAARVSRGTLSASGRCLRTTAAQYAIKRVWRFCANDGVHPTDALVGVIRRLTRQRTKSLPVALDWTAVRRFRTLLAAAEVRAALAVLQQVWVGVEKLDLAERLEEVERRLQPGSRTAQLPTANGRVR